MDSSVYRVVSGFVLIFCLVLMCPAGSCCCGRLRPWPQGRSAQGACPSRAGRRTWWKVRSCFSAVLQWGNWSQTCGPAAFVADFSKWNIWFLSSEIIYSISHNERPILWFTSSLWQKCCHLHSVISQPSVSVPEVVLVCAPVLMVRSGSIDVVEALPLFSILSLLILASFPHLLSSCLIPPTWLASREEETRGDI